MPTSSGDALPPHVPSSTFSPVDSNTLPTHRVHHDHPTTPTHRRSTSQGDFELQDFKFPDTGTSHRSSHKKKARTSPPARITTASSSNAPETSHLLHDDQSESDLDDDTEHQMGRRVAGKPKNTSVRTSSADSLKKEKENGHATGTMNGAVELRRKHASTDSHDSASQAASLINRSSFSLDEPVPAFAGNDSDGPSKGFFELSKKDQRNFLLLILLYFLQGIPMGLAMGSVPFLLKTVVSYSAIGVFSLAAYPYSLKLLWSPIVDAVWTPRLGRRKSWILPIQTVSGISMIWLGSQVEQMMSAAGEKDNASGIWSFTWWWFGLVFLCATQDIAVDGKARNSLIIFKNSCSQT